MAVSWRSWLANEGVKHLCLFIWLSLNVLLFWKTFLLYNQGPEYHYLHQMLGLGLCLSRASASVLNLNCSLILLPMCRTLLAYLRGSQKVPSRRTRRLLDKSRTFHITCGVTICIFSGVHVAAHLVNALNFSVNYSEDFVELNAARYRDEDPRKLLFTTVPGLTGVCMVLVLFLMITASTYAIRVSNYDIFWYTHNLFFVFYMLLMLHVSGDEWEPYKLRRLYFIWVCRDIQSFRWFADLLCVLHNKFWQENRPDYVNIQLYLSQTDGIQKIIGEKYQALNSRLFIGRPRWKLLFDEIAKCNRGKTVGVFCCGPSSISKTLHKLCNRNNSYGTRFEYNKESFS
uniref:NADPH oxidase 4 n=1 Tax=Suricata suricatta TaxID=37032 RepID=A0A673T761_SURSU